MQISSIKNIMRDIKPGVYANIVYSVECPVKAKFQKEGVVVKKIVSMTARFKIKYSNIKTVKERREQKLNSDNRTRTNNFVPIIENCLYRNTNTGYDYLNVYTVKNNHKKSLYEVIIPKAYGCSHSILDEEELKESGYLIDSYFTKKRNTEMMRINTDHIASINHIVVGR